MGSITFHVGYQPSVTKPASSEKQMPSFKGSSPKKGLSRRPPVVIAACQAVGVSEGLIFP